MKNAIARYAEYQKDKREFQYKWRFMTGGVQVGLLAGLWFTLAALAHRGRK